MYFLSVVLLLAVLPTASVILEALLSPHRAQSIEPKLTAEEIKDWDEAELSACWVLQLSEPSFKVPPDAQLPAS
jgi:hypothetical protein